jgi:hypothetical protein
VKKRYPSSTRKGNSKMERPNATGVSPAVVEYRSNPFFLLVIFHKINYRKEKRNKTKQTGQKSCNLLLTYRTFDLTKNKRIGIGIRCRKKKEVR